LDALAGSVEAVCTLPINKLAIRQSIEGFQGHTEYIADLCDVTDYSMMLASERLAVAHVSTHVSLLEAVGRVRIPRIVTVGRLLTDMLRRFLTHPRIAVTGLNPHAGESGSFGAEDRDHILPAVAELNRLGYPVEGPIPADTVFLRAFNGAFDGVVCMYHDQGHIPMKTMDFDGTVNVTLGLPIIRTSVDHGTAYDIAYQGLARLTNTETAFRYAVKLVDSK
jgi:4-hydroxythreonine-4-phosphate dehydrogenase